MDNVITNTVFQRAAELADGYIKLCGDQAIIDHFGSVEHARAHVIKTLMVNFINQQLS